jgi:hypothetical protein
MKAGLLMESAATSGQARFGGERASTARGHSMAWQAAAALDLVDETYER